MNFDWHLSSISPQPVGPRVCSVKHCHVSISAESKHKLCPGCRELEKKKKRRQRNKEDTPAPEKRLRLESDGPSSPSCTISGENDAAEGQTSHTSAQSMLSTLREVAKSSESIVFHGTCPIQADNDISDRERVQMMAKDIWGVTGFRFTVRDNKPLPAGHRTRYFCSQDEARKKKAKPSQKPGVNHREHVGMKRFPCQSSLTITYRHLENGSQISIKLHHLQNHPHYVDVSMPEGALDIIREHAEWLKPTPLVAKVQRAFPTVTSTQIHTAWRECSQVHWKRHDLQMLSAETLLGEYADVADIFKIDGLPEGLQMLAWGMRDVGERLKGQATEIGMDATYNTNSKHLELYSIMSQYDGAGFPLSYCLLTTATAIDQGKRTIALSKWCRRVRDEYV